MPKSKNPDITFTVVNRLPKFCDGCHYKGKVANMESCDYYLQTCQRRPCPVGEGCTVRKEKDECKLNWNRRIAL